MSVWRVASVETVTFFHDIEAVSADEAKAKVLALDEDYWETFVGHADHSIVCLSADLAPTEPPPKPVTVNDAAEAMRRIAAGEPCDWVLVPETVDGRLVMVLQSPTGDTFSAPVTVGDAATVVAQAKAAAAPKVLMPHGHKPCQRCGVPTRSDLCQPCGKAAMAEVDDAIRVKLT